MDDEISLKEEVEAYIKANKDLLKRIDARPFERYLFEKDTILQRLPDGMRPEDTLECHKSRCQEQMTETHHFPSKTLAMKFIRARFPTYNLFETTDEHKLYLCDDGYLDRCTGYVKLFLNLDDFVVRACYGHYAHGYERGNPRFTAIQYATVRLYCEYYWKSIVGPMWNAQNIIYCFKRWYDESHSLHYLNLYDIRVIAEELGRHDAARLELKDGVFHEERKKPTEKDKNSSDSTDSKQTESGKSGKVSPTSPIEEGTSGAPKKIAESVKPASESTKTETKSKSASPKPVAGPMVQFCLSDEDLQLLMKKWKNSHFYSTELKNMAYMTMITATARSRDSQYNDAQQLFEMLNQTSQIAQTMIDKINQFIVNKKKSASRNNKNPIVYNTNDPYFKEFHPLRRAKSIFARLGAQANLNERASSPESNEGMEYGPKSLLQPPMASLVTLLKSSNPQPSLEELKEKDYENYLHHMKTSKNIWAMPLPNSSFIPSRLYWLTGINLKQRMREIRERELREFEAEIREGLANLRNLNLEDSEHDTELRFWKRFERMRAETLGEAMFAPIGDDSESKQSSEHGTQSVQEDEEHSEDEDLGVALTKNQKKRLKKKEKKRQANEAAAAAAAERQKRNQPLRHLD